MLVTIVDMRNKEMEVFVEKFLDDDDLTEYLDDNYSDCFVSMRVCEDEVFVKIEDLGEHYEQG